MSGWSEYAKLKEELRREAIARKAMFSSREEFKPKPKVRLTYIPPWKRKQKSRKRNKIARMSRKRNKK